MPLRYNSDLSTPAKQTNSTVALCGCEEDDAELLPLNEMIHAQHRWEEWISIVLCPTHFQGANPG